MPSTEDLAPGDALASTRPVSPIPEILPPAGLALAPLSTGAGLASGLPQLSPDDPLYETAQAAHQYMEQAKAPATRRAYASDWRDFATWCQTNGLASLPATPSTVALYLASLAQSGEGKKPLKAVSFRQACVIYPLHS